MQLASWLLIRRAVNEGEMTLEQADEEEHKVKLQAIGSSRQSQGIRRSSLLNERSGGTLFAFLRAHFEA